MNNKIDKLIEHITKLEQIIEEQNKLIEEYKENYLMNMCNSLRAISGEFYNLINPFPAIIKASYSNKMERYEVKIEDVICIVGDERTKTILLNKKIIGIGPNERETNKVICNIKWDTLINQFNNVNINLFQTSKSVVVNLRHYEMLEKNILTSENLPKGYEELSTIQLVGKYQGHFINRKTNFNRVFTLQKHLVDYKLQNGLPL